MLSTLPSNESAASNATRRCGRQVGRAADRHRRHGGYGHRSRPRSASSGEADAIPLRRLDMSDELTPVLAKDLARDAYLFGLPLVYIDTQIGVLTYVVKPEGFRAPINQFAHHPKFPDASNKTVVGFNVDTLYSLAQLDVSPEPIVLTVPKMGDRFWIVQVIDGWNNVPHAPGSRTVGGDGGNFGLTGPGWQGELPDDVTELPMATATRFSRDAPTPAAPTTTPQCTPCKTSSSSCHCRNGKPTTGRRGAVAPGREGCPGSWAGDGHDGRDLLQPTERTAGHEPTRTRRPGVDGAVGRVGWARG